MSGVGVMPSAALAAQTPEAGRGLVSAPTGKARLSYADARPVLEALPDGIPPALTNLSAAGVEAAWPDWISRHDAEIRRRLERGDEDSVVNLWLYGTSFTTLPPARPSDLAASGVSFDLAEVGRRRLDDFLAALASPGDDERLQFVRQFMLGRGLDASTAAGRGQIGAVLEAARVRAVREFADYDRTLEAARRQDDPAAEVAAYATIFADRGLSSDTSVPADFAVEQTLRSLLRAGILAPGRVRRVAVVGPGLDFVNKADGRDVYPQQTVQPFALVDSLRRLGLAREGDLRVLTFDLSPRVNHHLGEAVRAADEGRRYVVRLPLPPTDRWEPDLTAFWERFGDQIGDDASIASPQDDRGVRVRTVRVRPDVVRSIEPHDLNIVVERLDPLAPGERFDLVVGTNIFVYYDPFEQALAMANVARMLRPGGVLLSNTLMLPTPPMASTAAHAVITYSDRQLDHMFWYRREGGPIE